MDSEAPRDLPVYTRLDEITGTLAREGVLILNAETGSGKTTIVPWGLLRHPSFREGKIILMEPRRIAARAADRIAHLLGEKTGHTVGLQDENQTIVGPGTVLEVVTYGVFIRIIQSDQELAAGCGTLIFDEFHERRIPTDLSFAFAMECRETIRPDLQDALHVRHRGIGCQGRREGYPAAVHTGASLPGAGGAPPSPVRREAMGRRRAPRRYGPPLPRGRA